MYLCLYLRIYIYIYLHIYKGTHAGRHYKGQSISSCTKQVQISAATLNRFLNSWPSCRSTYMYSASLWVTLYIYMYI